MRHYDDPIEVRRGGQSGGEEPDQFLWRGRLWQVKEVVAYWVETGAWWRTEGHDLLAEHETWRVVARRTTATGVFDLSFDWTDGSWRLIGCVD